MPTFFLLKTAWRNILRQQRRSLVTLLAVTSGLSSVILFGGFIEANYQGLRESVIRSQYGHLQIFRDGYAEGYRQEPEAYRLDPELVERIDALLAEQPEVLLTTQRLEFTGLLGNDEHSQASIVRGVDPDNESMINSALTIIAGDDFSGLEPEEVLLGEGLAAALNAEVGSYLTLMSTTVDGVMNAVDVKVQGVFQSFAKEYDDRAMMMTMTQAQSLLGTDAVDNIVVLLDDTAQTDAVLERLADVSRDVGLPTEMKAWHELASFYHKVVNLYDGFFLFITLVIAVVVLFGIANTMMIAVMERTVEIGTLRALGTRRAGIVTQFLVEGVMLAALASALGVLVGIGLAWVITSLEVMMPAPPGSSKGFPLRIAYVPVVWLAGVLCVLAIAVFAALVPAAQASRRPIVDALRYV